jgi:hypothetical protein
MMMSLNETWAQREYPKNSNDQARVLCFNNPDQRYNITREEHRRKARYFAECTHFTPLPQTDEETAELQREQHAVFERMSLKGQVIFERKPEEKGEEEEWSHYPDKLTGLISKQLEGLYNVRPSALLEETQIRIHEIAQAFLQYEPQLVFNLGSVLDREILFTILQPIFAFFEKNLRESKPYAFFIDGRGCMPYTTEYTLLHEYMQKYGYSVDIAKQCIEEEKIENRPPVLGTHYIHYREAVTSLLSKMDPAALRFRAPKRPSVYEQVQALKKARAGL